MNRTLKLNVTYYFYNKQDSKYFFKQESHRFVVTEELAKSQSLKLICDALKGQKAIMSYEIVNPVEAVLVYRDIETLLRDAKVVLTNAKKSQAKEIKKDGFIAFSANEKTFKDSKAVKYVEEKSLDN